MIIISWCSGRSKKEGWTITHDPLPLVFEDLPLKADLGAERTFAAEKAGRKVAVEVKDLDSASVANDLHKLIGQMQLYQLALEDQEPDRELFLAVGRVTYDKLFQKPSFKRVVQRNAIMPEVLRAEAKLQFPTIPRLKLIASCDRESGQFLLIMIGWDNRDHWHHSITFHAQLIDGKVIIEADMTEGLKPLLVEAGIREEDFLSDREKEGPESAQIAA